MPLRAPGAVRTFPCRSLPFPASLSAGSWGVLCADETFQRIYMAAVCGWGRTLRKLGVPNWRASPASARTHLRPSQLTPKATMPNRDLAAPRAVPSLSPAFLLPFPLSSPRRPRYVLAGRRACQTAVAETGRRTPLHSNRSLSPRYRRR